MMLNPLILGQLWHFFAVLILEAYLSAVNFHFSVCEMDGKG